MTTYHYNGKFNDYIDDEYDGVIIRYDYDVIVEQQHEEGHGFHTIEYTDYELKDLEIIIKDAGLIKSFHGMSAELYYRLSDFFAENFQTS